MAQEDYNRHYDSTAAKGLCWDKCGRKALKYKVRLSNGKYETVKSLWCFECSVKLDDAIDATAEVC